MLCVLKGFEMDWFTNEGQQKAATANDTSVNALYRHLIKPGSKFTAVSPNQEGCGLTFTPLCAIDLSETYTPGQPAKVLLDKEGKPVDRFSAFPDSFSPWFFKVPGIIRLGKNRKQVTILLKNWDAGNRSRHPYGLVLDAAWKDHHGRKKQDCISTPFGTSVEEGWCELLKSTNNPDGTQNFRALNNVDAVHIFPSLIYAIGGREKNEEYIKQGAPLGASEQDDVPLIIMSSAAAGSIKSALNQTKNPEDIIKDHGDFGVLRYPSIIGSLFIHVYSRKTNNCAALKAFEAEKYQSGAVANPAGWGHAVRPRGTEKSGDSADGFGYASFVSKTYEGTINSGTTIDYRNVVTLSQQVCRHPQDYLNLVSDEELPDILYDTGIPPGLLWFAYRDNPKWIPERVKDLMASKTVHQVHKPEVQNPVNQQSVHNTVITPGITGNPIAQSLSPQSSPSRELYEEAVPIRRVTPTSNWGAPNQPAPAEVSPQQASELFKSTPADSLVDPGMVDNANQVLDFFQAERARIDASQE